MLLLARKTLFIKRLMLITIYVIGNYLTQAFNNRSQLKPTGQSLDIAHCSAVFKFGPILLDLGER